MNKKSTQSKSNTTSDTNFIRRVEFDIDFTFYPCFKNAAVTIYFIK